MKDIKDMTVAELVLALLADDRIPSIYLMALRNRRREIAQLEAIDLIPNPADGRPGG